MAKKPVSKKAASPENNSAEPAKKKKGKKKKSRISCFTVLAFFIILTTIGILGASAVVINLFSKYTNDLPPAEELTIPMPIEKTIIYASGGEVIAELYFENREYANAREIPDNVKLAFIAIEDERFYKHKGVDIEGLMRIGYNFIRTGNPGGGGSTITQQLARHLFLPQLQEHGIWERSVSRKVKEWTLAMTMERKYSKEEILTNYMNLIYFGHSAYGVKSAANVFFGKKLKDITLEEAALLAAVPNRPTFYSPFNRPENANRRRDTVLMKMRELNFITEGEYTSAVSKPIKITTLHGPAHENYKAPYFVTYVIDTIQEEIGIPANLLFSQGYNVYTTLDLKMNTYGEEALAYGIELAKERDANVTQGAIVSIEPQTGRILTMIGGIDFKKSKFNRAWQALRQPGSSFKPFVYMTALKMGYPMESTLVDAPVCFHNIPEKYCPKNYDFKYKGKMTFHQSLQQSRNVPAVKVGNLVGTENIIETARSLGITSRLDPVPSLPLGTCEVSPLEIATAYSGIANMGHKVTPVAVERIVDSKGKVIYEYEYKQGAKVLDDNVVARIIPVMMDVVRAGTGTRAKIGRPQAGKTGTTSDFRDSWFVGFVPQQVTAVWFGNDDNSPLRNRVKGKPVGLGITGGSIPAPVWAKFMTKALEGKPIREFQLPKTVPMKVYALDMTRAASGTAIMPGEVHNFIEPETVDFTNQNNNTGDNTSEEQNLDFLNTGQQGNDQELF